MDLNIGDIVDTELKRIQSKHQIEQLQLNKRSQDLNNIFNKLTTHPYSYDHPQQSQQFQQDLGYFFDHLLWAQKHSPGILCQLADMMAIQQVHDLHLHHQTMVLVKNYILVMCNCREGGLLAEMLLDHRLPHVVLVAFVEHIAQVKDEQEQHLEYVGSFLKSYHRLFRPEWLQKFIIEDGYFELLEISFKFFNCPEPLTKTTVTNITLAILGLPQVQHFILNNSSRYWFYQHIAQSLTACIRNELAEFGGKIEHISIKDNSAGILGEIEDKIAYYEDLSLACTGMAELFQLPFCRNVLLPLMIGSLKYENKPLFSLKFSLFILRKLIRTIGNWGLLQVLIRMLFIEDNVYYWPHTLNQAYIPQFRLDLLLNKQPASLPLTQEQLENSKQDYGNGIRKFYDGVLRSKDNHFILISTSLLNQLHIALQSEPQLAQQYHLHQGGKLNNQICEKLLQQLPEIHRLITIEALLNTLVVLNNSQHMQQQQLQHMYVHIFRKVIQETKASLKSHNELWDFLIEINEYDILKTSRIELGKPEEPRKQEEIFRVVFMWDIKHEESSFFSFYSSIPDSLQDNFRYLHAKYLLLRCTLPRLCACPDQPSLLHEYYSQISAPAPFAPGQTYAHYQLKCAVQECQIVDNKVPIPAAWLMDEQYLVLAHWNKPAKQYRIIMAIKYKHISSQLITRKDRIMVEIVVRGYDYRSERLRERHSVVVRGLEGVQGRMVGCQIKVREREMVFISGWLRKTEEALPALSLL